MIKILVMIPLKNKEILKILIILLAIVFLFGCTNTSSAYCGDGICQEGEEFYCTIDCGEIIEDLNTTVNLAVINVNAVKDYSDYEIITGTGKITLMIQVEDTQNKENEIEEYEYSSIYFKNEKITAKFYVPLNLKNETIDNTNISYYADIEINEYSPTQTENISARQKINNVNTQLNKE